MGMKNNLPGKSKRLFSHPVTIAAILLVMVVLVHFPLLNNYSQKTVPWVHPDYLYFCSVIEWNMHALQSDWPALYHLNILYPNSYVTFFGHPLYGESLFFLFANRCLDLDIHRSTVLYMFFSFWLGGLGCFLLARELSGRIVTGYLGAFLFIVNPFFHEISKQLNIQSFFWSGFILFFLVRLLRKQDWPSGLGLLFFCFIQGLFEIYHGFFVMGITIPLFFLFCLLFKAMHKKGVLILITSWLAGIALNVLMYFPFPRVAQTFQLHRKKLLHFRTLIDATYLLSPSSGPGRGHGSLLAFLLVGCGAMAFFIFGFLIRKKTAIWQWGLAFGLVVAGFLAGMSAWVWGANALLIVFLGFFSYLVFHGSPDLPVPWKIGWGVLGAQLLVFFRFDGLIPGSSVSIFGLLIRVVPMLSGLRYLFRGVFILVPLFIALLAAGVIAAVDEFRPLRRRWAVLLFASLILRCTIGYWHTTQARLPLDPAPYEAIEKERDRVLVEFPFWGTGKITHHALYSINTQFHYDYLVNGRVAFRTDAFYNVFQKSTTTLAPPNKMLPVLLEKYGADYIIFHWDLMRENKLQTEEQIAQLRSQIIADTPFVRVLADEKRFLVLRLKENFPLRVVRRCYSGFHLSRRDLVLELAEPYEKEIQAFLTRRPELKAAVSRPSPRQVRLSFPGGDFAMQGNPVEIHFADFVRINDIRLARK
jgi:hypothetical protein